MQYKLACEENWLKTIHHENLPRPLITILAKEQSHWDYWSMANVTVTLTRYASSPEERCVGAS